MCDVWPGLIKEVQEICLTVGLKNVTKRYVHGEEVKEYIVYYDMKQAKSDMNPL